MRTATLGLVLSASLASASSHAEPSLPKGWIAGGPPSVMEADPAPQPRSRAALQLSSSPRRVALSPVPIALDALDTIAIEPAPSAKEIEASHAPAGGEDPPDFFVAPGCSRASVSGHAVGAMTVDWLSRPIAPQSGLGPWLWHVKGGDGKRLYVRTSWETVDRLPDGSLRFTESVGRFHVIACKARMDRRYTAVARPIFGGLAFLFRTRCDRCAIAERDEVHAIFPPGDWGSDDYRHHILRLAPDGTASLRALVSRFRAQKFRKLLSPKAPVPEVDMDLLLGIEVAKGLGEPAPSAIGYVSAVRHVGF